MQTHERPQHSTGLTLADIYYIIFRHKWKILSFSVLGLAVAAVVYVTSPPMYVSEAKLLIRYVVESSMPSGIAGDPQIKNPDPRGDNIINSEVEVLQSLDLATQVVDIIGAGKILGAGPANTNKYQAAVLLQQNLKVEVPRRSNVLRIVFQNPNREVVQPVLTQIIEAYLRKHVQIHRSMGGFDDVLTQQTDALRSQLAQTEQDLRKARTNIGVVPLEEMKKAYSESLAKIRQELFNTQAELAQQQAVLEEHQKLLPKKPEASAAAPDAEVPPEKLESYRNIVARLDSFRKQEQGLLTQYTEENAMVRGIREQIAALEQTRQKLEADYPRLARLQPPSAKPGEAVGDFLEERARISIAALQTKIKVLNSQMDQLTAEAKAVNELEPGIVELQRKKELEEAKYRHFSTSLEQARFDETLSAGRMSNIGVAQAPSPAFRESRQLVQMLGLIALGGVVAGFALAFLIELVLLLVILRRRWNGIDERALGVTALRAVAATAVMAAAVLAADAVMGALGWHDAGVLQRFPAHLQQQPLLGVHALGLARRDAEESRETPAWPGRVHACRGLPRKWCLSLCRVYCEGQDLQQVFVIDTNMCSHV